MTTEEDGISFNAEYVKSLREENASWRHKLRETEQKLVQKDIQIELAKRGLDIPDPSIFNIPENMTPQEVVEHITTIFKVPNTTEHVETNLNRPVYPAGIPASATTSSPSPAQGVLGGRSIEEIKKDPKARQQVRDWYREQLGKGNDSFRAS